MEIGFDRGTGPVVYVLSPEEFREWMLTKERLKAREEEINRLHEWVKELEEKNEHQRAEIDRLRGVEAEARDWNRRYVELSTNIRSALRNVERDFL